MRRLSLALVSAVSVMTFTHVAAAADLGRPVYKAPPPAPPPVQDWSGIYSGWEGGYGWGKQSFAFTIPGDCFDCNLLAPDGGPAPWLSDSFEQFFPDVTLSSVNQRGWLFGSFVGAQKQWGSWVLGIETDIDAANIKGSATSSAVSNFDFFVTGRGQGVTISSYVPRKI